VLFATVVRYHGTVVPQTVRSTAVQYTNVCVRCCALVPSVLFFGIDMMNQSQREARTGLFTICEALLNGKKSVQRLIMKLHVSGHGQQLQLTVARK